MFSVTKYEGTAMYTWRNTGKPPASGPAQFHDHIDYPYVDLVSASRKTNEQKYRQAFTEWLKLLNDAMLLSAEEKKAQLALAAEKGKQRTDPTTFQERVKKTAKLTLPQKISDKTGCVTSLISACKLLAKYLCALIDDNLLVAKDTDPSKSYTSCCAQLMHLTMEMLVHEMHAKIQAKDKTLINGTYSAFSKNAADKVGFVPDMPLSLQYQN